MRPIYTLDFETDPFKHGRFPVPFVAGLFDGERFTYTWGEDCVEKILEVMYHLPPGIVYAHNGGRFDFFYMIDSFAHNKNLVIINSRIVKAHLMCASGLDEKDSFHELRDSFAIMPFGLDKFDKDKIDYKKFEKRRREKYRQEIIKYLRKDCTSLHELCVQFRERFGDNLTIGGTSMKKLKEMHKFDELDLMDDHRIRECFYFGGRVQCFEKGVLNAKDAKFKVFDINQCYPFSMRDFSHPIGKVSLYGNCITANTSFLVARGRSYGAFPLRTENGLVFRSEVANYSTSIHEYKAAVETGLFEPTDILETIDFEKHGNFASFVDTYHSLRKNAQLTGDAIGALFYKCVGNSAYGKFAQCQDNYLDYTITDRQTDIRNDGWEPCDLMPLSSGYIIWKKPSMNTRRYNVATGASITGAARSLIIRALANAKRPVYCDTDSIICESLKGVRFNDTELGAWKTEQTGERIAIAGKKLYSLFGESGKIRCETRGCKVCKTCVKMASKGVHLFPHEILHVASGNNVTWKNDAPTFNWKTREDRYIHRTVRMT